MNHILDVCNEKMTHVVHQFELQLNTVRTGAANASLVDGIEVDYYGSPTPLNQISSISIQEGKTLVIKPYDSSSLKDIEKAINASSLGLPPQSDGVVVRITVPSLTGETRKEYCKKVGKYAEESKVQVRNARRDCNDLAKKDDTLTEDLEKACLEKIQKLTDEYIAQIDQAAKVKEQEIMKV
ncbi:MAG: ribosome recycling factor [Erysipelotrichaceae bacterium]